MTNLETRSFSLIVGGTQYIAATLAQLAERGVAPADVLALAKRTLTEDVDARAEALRLSIATPGAGQAMEYQETQAQAFAALQASPASVTPAAYPMLAASIGIDIDPSTNAPATDVLGVARAVQKAYAAWLAAGAAIRGARLHGKAAIEAAATPAAAAQAFDAIDWPPLG
ncbi:hypothetical protein [Methylobacterium gnaphalii]|uniref:DUF4376 domain-containing protein n=1 Tax=Methylobacterium gnaphalii TaxID=1010610 RepID=A0A512JPN4_9HYPH|nr:hypothetical protein [Methylobacterium gnaphalii]GEP11823.1 hypothetical protein MGN01_36680 [Methylobacterium gnaphalii]GJD69407.1 hypothetical protein MMMDOFMJ_2338 [Methylobacterium gnaphalii]GLS49542.1 hypothetical protein GCM10007885_23910 [Methylobacterium gnaphalii]